MDIPPDLLVTVGARYVHRQDLYGENVGRENHAFAVQRTNRSQRSRNNPTYTRRAKIEDRSIRRSMGKRFQAFDIGAKKRCFWRRWQSWAREFFYERSSRKGSHVYRPESTATPQWKEEFQRFKKLICLAVVVLSLQNMRADSHLLSTPKTSKMHTSNLFGSHVCLRESKNIKGVRDHTVRRFSTYGG